MEKYNKRGDVTDVFTVAFWLLVIGIGVFSVMFIVFQITDPLRETAIGENNSSLAAISSLENYASFGLPGAFLVVFFGLLLGVLISSFFVKTHPIFIPIYILFSIVSLIVAPILGNVWGNFRDVEGFSELLELNSVTSLMNIILSNLVLVTIIVFILSLIIIFAKPGGGSIQQGGSNPY